MESEFAFYCPRCQHGRCHPGRATFTRLFRGRIVSAPDTPAFVCDVCGYTEFERASVQQLHHLLGGKSSLKEADSSKTKQYPVDEPGETGESRHPKT